MITATMIHINKRTRHHPFSGLGDVKVRDLYYSKFM